MRRINVENEKGGQRIAVEAGLHVIGSMCTTWALFEMVTISISDMDSELVGSSGFAVEKWRPLL